MILKLVHIEAEDKNHYCYGVDSSPACFGLERVADLEYSTGPYEFDTRVVWKDKEGRLWTARDSGCSCPTPFEKFKELERFDYAEIEEEYRKSFSDPGYGNRIPSPVEWDSFRRACGVMA